MKRVKYALKRFWTRTRGLVGRKRGGDGGGERSKDPSGVFLWRLIPLAAALAAAGVVFALLTSCESGSYYFPPFGASRSWCEPWSQTFGFMSTSAGVGFLVFLMMEVVTMILAQMWRERQIDRAERREEAAERRADAAERQADAAERQADAAERRAEQAEQARREEAERAERRANAAERRAELAEQARREEAERAERRAEAAERRAEAAERRESVLIELIESLKNGKDDASE